MDQILCNCIYNPYSHSFVINVQILKQMMNAIVQGQLWIFVQVYGKISDYKLFMNKYAVTSIRLFANTYNEVIQMCLGH